MKKNIIFLTILAGLLSFGSCDTFDYSDPEIDNSVYESDTEATNTNITIKEVKKKYSSAISNSSFKKVKEDLIFDGYVVANDVSGNLYQTLIIRKGDDAIVVAIQDYSLWTKYPVGTHVTVNLNGMYVGGYGMMPKIGTPYYTSSGNLRQGAMLKSLADTNITIIGFNENADEVSPVEIDASWLNKMSKDDWAPMLVKLTDVEIKTIKADGERRTIYACSDDKDAGYGVNDTILIGNTKLLLRTSTSSTIAYETVPIGKVDVTGVLTRYTTSWQLQLRDVNDVVVK